VTRATHIMRELGAPLHGLSTSGFRISFVTREEHLAAAGRALHRAFVEDGAGAIPDREE
jgi:aspartokinase